MARMGFGLAAAASLGFLAWFLVAHFERPGLSIGAALLGMPLLLSLFGLTKVSSSGITKDGKGAGWAAAVIALLGVGYMAAFFFGSWGIVAGLWLLLQFPMIVSIVTSPTSNP